LPYHICWWYNFSKNTNCLNFSLVKCVFWHNLIYTWLIQYSNSNKKSIVNVFMYKHASRDFNFAVFTSCILTSSTIRSWIASDKGMGNCKSCPMLARISMNISYVAWSKIILPRLSPMIISTKDIDPMLIPTSTYLYKFRQSHQDKSFS